MNASDPFNRLLRAAARAPQEAPPAVPFAVEAGVLTRWRSGEAVEEPVFLVSVFRRAALCASLVMVLALGYSWMIRLGETPCKTALPECAMTVQLRP